MAGWQIKSSTKNLQAVITVPASKSLSNRALILQKVIARISNQKLEITNISTADDTKILTEALEISRGEINIKNAGTCMRFLTAYYAATPGSEIVLNGDERMKERPIAGLVNVLNQLGASIIYLEKENYPPLKISGSKLKGGEIFIEAHETSQFASALMMVAPFMSEPLTININNQVTSFDYIEMTASLMREFGFQVSIQTSPACQIHLNNTGYDLSSVCYKVEADWSSAAFIYEAAALAETASILIPNLSLKSKQGDKRIASIMNPFFGVSTQENEKGIIIQKKRAEPTHSPFEINLSNNPDLAPPLVSSAAALGLKITFTGLSSLKIKESNRLLNLQQELNKLGYNIELTESDCLILAEPKSQHQNIESVLTQTENDHRLVMCFSLLALKNRAIVLSEISSVEKSFPGFWEEMEKLGMEAVRL